MPTNFGQTDPKPISGFNLETTQVPITEDDGKKPDSHFLTETLEDLPTELPEEILMGNFIDEVFTNPKLPPMEVYRAMVEDNRTKVISLNSKGDVKVNDNIAVDYANIAVSLIKAGKAAQIPRFHPLAHVIDHAVRNNALQDAEKQIVVDYLNKLEKGNAQIDLDILLFLLDAKMAFDIAKQRNARLDRNKGLRAAGILRTKVRN